MSWSQPAAMAAEAPEADVLTGYVPWTTYENSTTIRDIRASREEAESVLAGDFFRMGHLFTSCRTVADETSANNGADPPVPADEFDREELELMAKTEEFLEKHIVDYVLRRARCETDRQFLRQFEKDVAALPLRGHKLEDLMERFGITDSPNWSWGIAPRKFIPARKPAATAAAPP